MIIDFHCHIGYLNKEEHLNFKELKKSMKKFKIDKSVVFPFSGNNKSMIRDSLKILNYSKKDKSIIPFLRIDPNKINKKEFNNLIKKEFKGLKLHPSMQKFVANNPKHYWIYKICQEKNIPILFHSSFKDKKYSTPSRILKIAKKFPKLNIVMAHFFGGDFTIIKIAKNYPNLYVDTSINSGTLRRNLAVNKFKFKNLILASDIPYDSQEVTLMKIKQANLKKEDEDLILYKNAKKILN